VLTADHANKHEPKPTAAPVKKGQETAPARALSTLQRHNRDSSRAKAVETGIAYSGNVRGAFAYSSNPSSSDKIRRRVCLGTGRKVGSG
jgi:hypothetical protein